MKIQSGRSPARGAAARALLAMVFAAAPLVLAACTSADIWNAGDLAVWVRERAVEQGCQRETIELDEWYTAESDGNVWRGTCRDTEGNKKPFGANVDAVWKPSKPEQT